MKRQDREHGEQAAFIQWVDSQVEYPKLRRIYAVPNGGKRNIKTAVKMKAEGQRRGVPDLFLPLARGGFHGLFMETKVHPNKPTPEQIEYLDFLTEEGYCAVVCYGFEELQSTALWYMTLDTP